MFEKTKLNEKEAEDGPFKNTSYIVLLTGLVTFFEGLELVSVSCATFVQETLAPLRLKVEVEHRLRGATPAGIFWQLANVLGALGGNHDGRKQEKKN